MKIFPREWHFMIHFQYCSRGSFIIFETTLKMKHTCGLSLIQFFHGDDTLCFTFNSIPKKALSFETKLKMKYTCVHPLNQFFLKIFSSLSSSIWERTKLTLLRSIFSQLLFVDDGDKSLMTQSYGKMSHYVPKSLVSVIVN